MDNKKKKKTAKRQPWLRFRHRVVRNLACLILKPYSYLKYGVRVEKFKGQEKRPYLVLANHQTPFDQFFIGMAFKGPIYYMATEDIFSLGFVSSLLRYLVAPIPIQKQASDVKAVMTCMRVAREGGTIAICPEGNRTYSGRTEYMNPAIVGMVRALKVPVAFYRLEGGYGVQPRWSDVVRRGSMKGYVSRVLSPEEYAAMSDHELMEVIKRELWVDEACLGGEYRHPRAAEYLERALYVCPFCGLSTFESHRDTVKCLKCRRSATYLPTKELKGDFPYAFVGDWYDAQAAFINGLDVTEEPEPLYVERARLSEVIPYKKKQLMSKDAAVELYGHGVHLTYGEEELELPFGEISAAAVLGRNKLNLYHKGRIYQLKGDKRFNSLKYVHLCYRYKNLKKGDGNGQFLGL